MLEKMIQFDLKLEEFEKMLNMNIERTFEVTKLIELYYAVKSYPILEIKRDKYSELIMRLSEYYKKYNISEVEQMKDKIFIGQLSRVIKNEMPREINKFYK